MKRRRKRDLEQATARLELLLRCCSQEICTQSASVALVSMDVHVVEFVVAIDDDSREFAFFTPLSARLMSDEVLMAQIRSRLSSDERSLDLPLGGLADVRELEEGDRGGGQVDSARWLPTPAGVSGEPTLDVEAQRAEIKSYLEWCLSGREVRFDRATRTLSQHESRISVSDVRFEGGEFVARLAITGPGRAPVTRLDLLLDAPWIRSSDPADPDPAALTLDGYLLRRVDDATEAGRVLSVLRLSELELG